MPLVATHELNTPPSDPQIYNGFDVCRTFGILDKLLVLPGADPVYNLSRGMQGLAMEMMIRGFLVDPTERDRAITDVKERLKGINSCLAQIVHAISGQSDGFDNAPYFFNSSQQIQNLFYNVMRIQPIEKYAQGEKKLSMDEETLEKIRVRFPRARVIAAAILACRHLKKQLEKLEMEVDPDWRIRASVNIAGTNEGRWSYSQSFTGTGGNLQNVTESVRRMFISDQGWKLCGIDKEQAESRWVGLYCGVLFDDWSYLDLLESGDGHTAIARMVWQEFPWTGDLKKDRAIAERPFLDETYRQKCKKLGHATNIMSSPSPKTAFATGVPVHTIKDFQERYFTQFPCILKYHRWLAQQIQTRQFLVNAFGRRRDFFDRPDAEETIRQAAAFMQASSNADDINLGGWRMWDKMGGRIQLLTQEHDSWYFQFRDDDDEEEIIAEAKRHLKVEIPLTSDLAFSVPTEAKTGWNKGLRWQIDKDGNRVEINPRGLDKPGAARMH
jgi:DNA polymerase I-like protein with 3'-5' exonuclease and polymerase domains